MRGCSGDPAEEACEMALVAEAGAQPDFDQRQLVLRQQRFRSLNTKLNQILMRRGSGCSLELSREMKTAHPCHVGQLVEFQVPTVVVRNEVCDLS